MEHLSEHPDPFLVVAMKHESYDFDGEEFYVRLREQVKWRSIPVLVASVNEHMPQQIQALGGLAGNLRKPFGIDSLLEKIRANLK